MGIYLKIDKLEDDEAYVMYKFDSGIANSDAAGILQIDKTSGNCVVVQALHGDKDNFLQGLAYRGILRH